MLKERQKEILQIIEKNPDITLSQIANELKLSSVGNIHAHIQKLIKDGYLKKKDNRLFLTNRTEKRFLYIPFYGDISNLCFSDNKLLRKK